MGGVIRKPGGKKNTNLNVDRKNPGGYSSRDLEQMDRKNDGGYSARDLERMDRKNPGGNPKPSTTPKPVIKPIVAKPVVAPVVAPVAPAVVAPTKAEVTQATSTDMSDAEISISNKKKGRSQTILNTSGGLGSSSLNTTKKTLGA